MKSRIMMVAAMLGLLTTACNKDEVTPQDDMTVKTPITINASYGNNGSKVQYTESGSTISATWQSGDQLLVIYNNNVNTLTLSTGAGTANATFTGSISGTPSEGAMLVCYVKDQNTPSGTVTVNGDGSYIYTSDAFLGQDGTLAGAAKLNLYCGWTRYSSTSDINCSVGVNTSMMKFTVSIPSGDVGRNATLTYKSGDVEVSKASFSVDATPKTIYMSIPAGSLTGYQSVVYNCTATSTTKTEYLSSRANFVAGETYSKDITFVINGSLGGQFTINSNGDKIVFSKGNLQATTSDLGEHWSWAFAENQYDIIGNSSANIAITGNGTVSSNGTIDLFGWSTAATYFGIHNSSQNIYTGDFVDWGNNSITNGGIGPNIWRTITKDEMVYLFLTRQTGNTVFGRSNARFAGVKVNGTKGFILFPDNFVLPTLSGNNFGSEINNMTISDYATNINLTDWSALENAGCVFLPFAGVRLQNTINNLNSNAHYWYSTPNEYIDQAYNFNASAVNDQTNRCFGMSVRLVRDVE